MSPIRPLSHLSLRSRVVDAQTRVDRRLRSPGRATARRGRSRRSGVTRRRSRPLSTSTFGVGARESHDASVFYAHFSPTSVPDDEELATPFELGSRWSVVKDGTCRASRQLGRIGADVTPNLAGKASEEAHGEGVIGRRSLCVVRMGLVPIRRPNPVLGDITERVPRPRPSDRSGSTALAAEHTGRRHAGYHTGSDYVEIAAKGVEQEPGLGARHST